MSTGPGVAERARGLGDPGERARIGGPWLLAWLAFLPFALLTAEHLAASDTFWQLRTGLWMLDHGAIPAVDPFSWTAAGRPWTLNSWGFDLLLGVTVRLGGLAAVAALTGLWVAAIGALMLAAARRSGADPTVTGWVVLLTAPLMVAWLAARPQLADYVAVPLLVVLLQRLLRPGRPAIALAAVGLLFVVWVNLHAAVVLGLALIAASAVAVVLRREHRARAPWFLLALAVAALASLANPYGPGIYLQAGQVRDASGVVTEWQPLLAVLDPVQLVTAALGAVALVVALRRQDVVLAPALVVALAGSVVAIRVLPVLLILAAPVLAASLTRPPVLAYLRRRRTLLRVAAGTGLVAFGAVVAVGAVDFGRPSPALYPTALVRAMPAGNAFTSYLLGGYVAYERPDVKVSVDSRNDLYGLRLVEQQQRTLEGDGDVAAALAPVRSVLVPGRSGLAARLRFDPVWTLAGEDHAAVLFIRRR